MKSGFFDSMDGDRKYNAAYWAWYFAQFIGNGVYANPATCLQVRATAGLTVQLQPGACFINGYAASSDGTDFIALDHGGSQARIDRIVIRLDFAKRDVYPMLIKGTAAASPSPPDIVRDGSVYDLGIATITVPANATAITQANIEDTRPYSEICGFVAGIIKQIDTTDLFAQYKEEWNNFINDFIADDDRIYINTADETARKRIMAIKMQMPISGMLRMV